MNSDAYIVKRQFERVTTKIQVKYRLVADQEMDKLVASSVTYHDISLPVDKGQLVKDVMTVVTENISVGGLMIVGDQPFASGSRA